MKSCYRIPSEYAEGEHSDGEGTHGMGGGSRQVSFVTAVEVKEAEKRHQIAWYRIHTQFFFYPLKEQGRRECFVILLCSLNRSRWGIHAGGGNR